MGVTVSTICVIGLDFGIFQAYLGLYGPVWGGFRPISGLFQDYLGRFGGFRPISGLMRAYLKLFRPVLGDFGRFLAYFGPIEFRV